MTRIQVAVIAAIIAVAAIGGGYYYYWTNMQRPAGASVVYVPRAEVVTNMKLGVVFSVNVSVRNGVDVHNWTLGLSFDPKVLKAVGVAEGNFLKSGGATTFNSGTLGEGVIDAVGGVLTDAATVARGNGTLAIITFNITKEVGFSSLNLKNVKILNLRGESMPIDAVSGSFATIPWEGMPPSDYEDTLNVFTWGGMELPKFWNEGFYAFKKLYPKVDVKFSFWVDEIEALAKLKIGFTPDIVHPCSYSVKRWYDAGVIEALNITLIPLWKDVLPKVQTFEELFINGEQYQVPSEWGYCALLYRPDLLEQMGIPKYVTLPNGTQINQWDTWDLMFDPKGGKMVRKVIMPDSAIEQIPMAAVAAGIPGEEVWNMTREQLDKAREKLSIQKREEMIRLYWKVPADNIKALSTGEAVVAEIWGEEYVTLKSAGVNVTFSRPKEGAFTWLEGPCIVKGLKERNPSRYKVAHAFINAYIQAESGANEIDTYVYCGTNKDAPKLAKNQEAVKLLGFDDPTTLEKFNFERYMPNLDEWVIIYTEVKADP